MRLLGRTLAKLILLTFPKDGKLLMLSYA